MVKKKQRHLSEKSLGELERALAKSKLEPDQCLGELLVDFLDYLESGYGEKARQLQEKIDSIFAYLGNIPVTIQYRITYNNILSEYNRKYKIDGSGGPSRYNCLTSNPPSRHVKEPTKVLR